MYYIGVNVRKKLLTSPLQMGWQKSMGIDLGRCSSCSIWYGLVGLAEKLAKDI